MRSPPLAQLLVPPDHENPEVRAVEVVGRGDADVLKLASRDEQLCGPEDVRIEVAAAGVNFTDVHQRLGCHHY